MRLHHYLFSGLTISSLLIPLVGLASPAVFDNGFYAGFKIGAQQARAEWDQASNVSVGGSDGSLEFTFSLAEPDQDQKTSQTNLMGNFVIGYARVINRFFLAGEASVNLAENQTINWNQSENLLIETFLPPGSPPNLATDALNINSEVSLENTDIILDLRPGFLLAKNFVFYGRVGVAFNKLSIEQEGVNTFNDGDGTIINTAINSSEEKDVYGLRLGLGVEYKVTPQLALNMDYVFTDYGSIDTEFAYLNTFNDLNDLNDDIITTQIDINSNADVIKNTATVGFNWYFGGKKPQPVYRGPDK